LASDMLGGFSSIGMPPFPVREGYAFMGWFTTRGDGSGNDFHRTTTPIHANLTLYANWMRANRVTFVPNHDDGSGIPAGEIYRMIPNGWGVNQYQLRLHNMVSGSGYGHYTSSLRFTRPGFTLIGWNTSADGSGTPFNTNASTPTPGIAMTPVTDDMRVYAQWGANVIFNNNYATLGGNNQTTTRVIAVGRNFINNHMHVNTSSTPVEAPTSETWAGLHSVGLPLIGWNTVPDGTGYWFSAANTVTEPITFFAIWGEQGVVFHPGVAAGHPGVRVPHDYVVFRPDQWRQSVNQVRGYEPVTDPVWEGHTFQRWVYASGSTYDPDAYVTGSITIYAIWSAQTVFDANGGTLASPATVDRDIGRPLGIYFATDPARDGWNFRHWTNDRAGAGDVYTSETPISSRTELFAQWMADVRFYPITLGVNRHYTAINISEGAAVGASSMPANPERTDYRFVRWERVHADGSRSEFDYETEITDGHINVVAIWEPRMYTVTYTVLPGDVPLTNTVSGMPEALQPHQIGRTVAVAGDLSTTSTIHNGLLGTWTFSGWTTVDVYVIEGAFTMPGDNVEFTGSWTFTANPSFTVSYEVTGIAPATHSGIPVATSHQQGTTVTVAGGLTTTSNSNGDVLGTWTFNGWNHATITGTTFTMPGEAVVFTGSWTFTVIPPTDDIEDPIDDEDEEEEEEEEKEETPPPPAPPTQPASPTPPTPPAGQQPPTNEGLQLHPPTGELQLHPQTDGDTDVTAPETETSTEEDDIVFAHGEDDEGIAFALVDPEVPLLGMFGDGQSWALWNLILSVIGAILAIIMGIRVLIKKRHKKDEDEYDRLMDVERGERERSRLALILSIPILAIIGIVIFILTQDMRLPMVMTDWWTLLHAILVAVGALANFFAYRKESDDEDEAPRLERA